MKQKLSPVVKPHSKLELGDLLVGYLEQLDVKYVFGVPGGAIEPLYNALARSERRNGPRVITARHETGAAFMAEGYTRQTGKIGVCCATTGPGTTNLITGIASAYEDQIPMLVITAQTALANFGKGALQESSCTGVNTVAMLEYCTRYNTLISHIDQFEQKLVTAIMTAHQSPNGPVHLSVPLDILRSLAPMHKPSYNVANLVNRYSLIDQNATDELCGIIETAQNIVFVIGDDCTEAVGTILELAILLKAPVVTTPHGKGLVNPYHPLYRGVIGFAGHVSANEILSDPQTEVVLAVGTKLGEWATGGWDRTTVLNERLIHIESDEGHLTRSPMARLHIRGRIVTIFEDLLKHIREHKPELESQMLSDAWRKKMSEEIKTKGRATTYFRMLEESKCSDNSTPIKPQRFMNDLAELFPPHACYVVDNGNSVAWAIHYLHPFDRRISGHRDRNCGQVSMSLEFASMGWAIGAAIGFAIGNRDQPVVCITGDGSLLMSGQEITVAIQEQLSVVFIILNDSAYGMVKHGQRLGGAEAIGFQLPTIDFAAYAKVLGAEGYIVNSPQDLHNLDIDAICKRPGPTLIDVRIDPEETPPMKSRVSVLSGVK